MLQNIARGIKPAHVKCLELEAGNEKYYYLPIIENLTA